jgi:hypothetical protein
MKREKKDAYIPLRVATATKEALIVEARKRGRSLANHCVLILEKWLKQHKPPT